VHQAQKIYFEVGKTECSNIRQSVGEIAGTWAKKDIIKNNLDSKIKSNAHSGGEARGRIPNRRTDRQTESYLDGFVLFETLSRGEGEEC
jgi:hypothetical protein